MKNEVKITSLTCYYLSVMASSGMCSNGLICDWIVGARVAQYCGRCIHTKIVNHSAWGKEGYNNNIVNLILFFKSRLMYMYVFQSN